MEGGVIEEFFREPTKIPFEGLPTVLLTGRAVLDPGTNIDAEAFFRNVPIYEIPGWERGKNKQVKIPHPQIPYVVLSAKKGLEIRGIVKDLNDLQKQEGNKRQFPNQVALDIALKDKIVNVMIFGDHMKVAGSTKPEHIVEAFIYLKNLLIYLNNQGVKVYDKSPILIKLAVDMENVVFDLGFKVRTDALMEKAIQCGLRSPPDSEAAVRVLYPTGMSKAKGGDRDHNFRIRHTGKVVFSGPNRKLMEPVYEKFWEFITANEQDIRFV